MADRVVMSKQDWVRIVRLIQDKFRTTGRAEMADLDLYHDKSSGLPDPQVVVKKMLDNLDSDPKSRQEKTSRSYHLNEDDEEEEGDDWVGIVRLIQEKLRESGHHDIADLDNYYERDDDGDRYLPDPKTIAVEMMEALERYLRMSSMKTARGMTRHSMSWLRDNVEGFPQGEEDDEESQADRDLSSLIDNIGGMGDESAKEEMMERMRGRDKASDELRLLIKQVKEMAEKD